MSSSSLSDQQPLITTETENPPTYQEAIHQANLYGTFVPSSNVVYPIPYSQPIPVQVIGNCPKCHIGDLDGEFTCLGLCCAICCFPIGILCCLACRQRRCNFCAATFP